MEEFTIAYHYPVEPEGAEPATVATIALRGAEYPLTVRRRETSGGAGSWGVEFGDLADEGRYPTFAEAVRAAHQRALGDAEELWRATQDGGY